MIKVKTQNELDYLEIVNESAEAKITLQGAHIFHFQAKNKKPLLWLSDSSYFKRGKAVRGGIPICWPWFGQNKENKDLPSHGFARTALWEHIETKEVTNKETKVTLCLKSSEASLKLWPYQFELLLDVIISDTLRISLITKNCDQQDFTITSALHSYFSIDDINQTYVEGLDNKRYYDKVLDAYDNQQQGKVYFSQETDRIYQSINTPIYLREDQNVIKIESKGSNTAVIWNPWKELADNMVDLSDYKTMLCVETSNVLEDERKVKVNESHTLTTTISQ